MSFITQKRIFSRPVKISQFGFFLFDLMFVVSIWLVVDSWKFMKSFAGSDKVLIGSTITMTLFCGIFLYGVRISTYIAILRNNRAPQVAEWVTFLAGIGLAAVFLLFGGSLLNLWAEAHGYQRCPTEQTRNADAVFARNGTPCPAHWKGRPSDN